MGRCLRSAAAGADAADSADRAARLARHPKGTPARTTATVHLLTMLTATVVFALAFVAQLDGYDDGQVEALALICGLAAEALLAAGGYIGGTIVFVYGNRVLNRPDVPVRDALVPGRAEGAEGAVVDRRDD